MAPHKLTKLPARRQSDVLLIASHIPNRLQKDNLHVNNMHCFVDMPLNLSRSDPRISCLLSASKFPVASTRLALVGLMLKRFCAFFSWHTNRSNLCLVCMSLYVSVCVWVSEIVISPPLSLNHQVKVNGRSIGLPTSCIHVEPTMCMVLRFLFRYNS